MTHLVKLCDAFCSFPRNFVSRTQSSPRVHQFSQASLRLLPLLSAVPIACDRSGPCNPVPSGPQSGRAMNADCRESAPARLGIGVAPASPEFQGNAGALSERWSHGEAVLSLAWSCGASLWAQLNFGKSRNQRGRAQFVPKHLEVVNGAGSVSALRASTILVGRRRTCIDPRPAPDRLKRKRCRGRESPRRHAG